MSLATHNQLTLIINHIMTIILDKINESAVYYTTSAKLSISI